MTTVTFRLPFSLAKKLDRVARKANRPKCLIILKAIEAYLEEYVDLQIAMERLRDTSDTVINGKELKRSMPY